MVFVINKTTDSQGQHHHHDHKLYFSFYIRLHQFQKLNHDGTSHFCFQILRIHNRPHIFFDLTDHTRYIDGERENNVSQYTLYNVPPTESVLNNFLRRSN